MRFQNSLYYFGQFDLNWASVLNLTFIAKIANEAYKFAWILFVASVIPTAWLPMKGLTFSSSSLEKKLPFSHPLVAVLYDNKKIWSFISPRPKTFSAHYFSSFLKKKKELWGLSNANLSRSALLTQGPYAIFTHERKKRTRRDAFFVPKSFFNVIWNCLHN